MSLRERAIDLEGRRRPSRGWRVLWVWLALCTLAGGARVSAQHPIGLVRSESERATVEKVAKRRFGNWGGLIVGNPEEVAAALSREVALGVEMFVLQFHDFGDPASLQAFARDVVPLL